MNTVHEQPLCYISMFCLLLLLFIPFGSVYVLCAWANKEGGKPITAMPWQSCNQLSCWSNCWNVCTIIYKTVPNWFADWRGFDSSALFSLTLSNNDGKRKRMTVPCKPMDIYYIYFWVCIVEERSDDIEITIAHSHGWIRNVLQRGTTNASRTWM